MNVMKLIEKSVSSNDELLSILLTHSESVAQRALQIVKAHPEFEVDSDFIYEAAMLHDIGIQFCDAPSIACHGTHPYIEHGFLGAEYLRQLGFPKHALVCERHTGTGLTKEMIVLNGWNLPQRDMRPVSLEEQMICYADKFYSKTSLSRCKSFEEVVTKMARYGVNAVQQLKDWNVLFSIK